MKRYLFTVVIIIPALLLPMLTYAKAGVGINRHTITQIDSYNHIVKGLSKKVPVHMDTIKSLLAGRVASIHTMITSSEDQAYESDQQLKADVLRIIIDAGHGGRDPGSAGVSEDEEKLYTLSLSHKIYRLLESESTITPILTRHDDTYLTTEDRVAVANRDQVDIFISLHANSFTNKNTRGTETYYHNSNSIKLADILHEHILQATGFPDRKVRKMDYKVLKETTMPAALLEIGYLSNKVEESIMTSEEMQNKVAASIVEGIKQYIMLEL